MKRRYFSFFFSSYHVGRLLYSHLIRFVVRHDVDDFLLAIFVISHGTALRSGLDDSQLQNLFDK